jgi:hypothetical protein
MFFSDANAPIALAMRASKSVSEFPSQVILNTKVNELLQFFNQFALKSDGFSRYYNVNHNFWSWWC